MRKKPVKSSPLTVKQQMELHQNARDLAIQRGLLHINASLKQLAGAERFLKDAETILTTYHHPRAKEVSAALRVLAGLMQHLQSE